MKLHWSPRSPFVRKVMIVLHEAGLTDRVTLVRSPVMMAAPPNPEVIKDNPLGKIPALVLNDGTALFDSRVICAYLAGIGHNPDLMPEGFAARIECLRWEAFGDGLTDILLIWRIEMGRGAARNPVISDGFDTKVRAAVTQLAREVPALAARPFGIGHAALLSALGQMDFRYPDSGWKAAFPGLADWQAGHLPRASLVATAIKDDGALPMGEIAMPLRFGAA
jgi:glutathione S-transferase